MGKNNSSTAQQEKHVESQHFIEQIKTVNSGGLALLNPKFMDLRICSYKRGTLQQDNKVLHSSESTSALVLQSRGKGRRQILFSPYPLAKLPCALGVIKLR